MINVDQSTSLDGLDPLVKLFQESGEGRYFDLMLTQCKGYIQGRAIKASLQFGLEAEDCESTLLESLWKSAEMFNPEMGVSFAQFANVGFKKNLTWLFGRENRDNHFFGPCTKSDLFEEAAIANKSFHMFYMDGGLNLEEKGIKVPMTWDLSDPRMDVENLICEQDAARQLMEEIKKVDEVAGDVAALVAVGRDPRETAVIMGYVPEGTSQRTAQLNWVRRKLRKCIPPTERHYFQMGIPIPIKMRA